MLGFLFTKVAGLQTSNFFKKETPPQVFSVGRYCEIFKNNIFIENLRWLLLTILPHHNKVSWGACSSILLLHALSILVKNFHKTLHKYNTLTWQYNFFLVWIDLLRAFDFRIYFGKTLIAFDFDEKLTQSVAQITT